MKKYITLLPIVLFIATACTEKLQPGLKGSGTTDLALDVSIGDATKAPIDKTQFENGMTLGLFVCEAEEDRPGLFKPHMKDMNNIRATWTKNRDIGTGATVPGFCFSYPSDLSMSFPILSISDFPGYNADIYAYAPWIGSISTPREIPYTFSSQTDIMRARENDGTDNRNIEPDGTPKTIRLHFDHALTRIRVGVKLLNPGFDNASLSNLNIAKSDGGSSHLYTSGTYDAIDDMFSNMAEASRLTLNGQTGISTGSYSYLDLMMAPTELMDDGDLEISFTINGFNFLKDEHKVYSIKKSDVQYDEGKYGFRAGYTYTFLFDVDNYIHIAHPVRIDKEWTEDDSTDPFYI